MGSKYDLAIVTGGSSGIGCSIIEGLIQLDPNTVIFNLSRRFPKHFTNRKSIEHISCNLADREERSDAFERLERSVRQTSRTGKIALINNAGFGMYGDIRHNAPEEHLELLEVNLCAVVDLTTRMMPLILERGGAIVNVASTAAFQPTPHFATYGASKAFVLNWTLSLAAELKGTKACAIAVCPGPTRTDFFNRAGFKSQSAPTGFSQAPETVAKKVLASLATGRSLVVPGFRNTIISALSSLLPLRLRTRVAGKVLRRLRDPSNQTN